MTETKKAVRLLRDWAHFPPTGITVNWRRGEIVEDPEVIALLVQIHAPLERIELPADPDSNNRNKST
jgi:hypothetical protein